MHRNNIIAVCTIFCVVAVGAGLLVARLTSQSGVTAQSSSAGATSVPSLVAASQPTGIGVAAPTAAAITGQPEPTSGATRAPAIDTAVAVAGGQQSTSVPIAAPVPLAPIYIEYTVQKGDILYTIAKNHSVTIEDILAINQISNPSSLSVGQIIRIPKK
jgi:LysM repeat protein